MSQQDTRRSFLTKVAAAGGLAASQPLSGFGQGLESAVEGANTYSSPSNLEITDLRYGYIGDGGHLFVKIHTNQDVYGCGEGVDAVTGTAGLVEEFGEHLEGENPLNVHRLFHEIRRSGFFGGAQSGVYVAVLSAVETALWDLAGKALEVPVYQLLGGKFRDRVRLYMDTALYQWEQPKPERFAKDAKRAVDMGMTAVKFDLDQANDPARYDEYNWTASPEEIQRMYDQMAAAREAVGPDIDIMADMHGRYDLPSGKQVAQRLEPVNLMWLEEPVPAHNSDAYKVINESSSTPLTAGENHYLVYDFRDLLETEALDFVMPDLQKVGGLGEGQRVANYANVHYVPFAPHMVASYLGASAAAHVCASVPNFAVLEWQIYFHEDPMWKEIVTFDGPMVEDGYMPVRDEPGIGVDINEEAISKYAEEGVPAFE